MKKTILNVLKTALVVSAITIAATSFVACDDTSDDAGDDGGD